MLRLAPYSRHTLVRTILVAVLVALVGSAFGCASTKFGQRASRAAADVALPASEEEELGNEFSKKVEQELTLHSDERVQSYLREMGQNVVNIAGNRVPRGIEFEFHVVDAPDTVNAFAGPGGQIYFYSGLLRRADSKAEVLAVMCHEIAHVTERHIAERMVAIYGLEALSSAALGRDPSLLESVVSNVAKQGFMLKYSRSHETEADSRGLAYMFQTPYNPKGFISFFEKLSGGAQPPVFLSSHPAPSERIDQIQSTIAKRDDPSDKWGRDEHRNILTRISSHNPYESERATTRTSQSPR